MSAESLQGKFAIVTGSAKGIGAATCVELASKGALVAINYPFEEELKDAESVLQRVKDTGASAANDAFIVEADLSTTDGPAKLVKEALRRSGRQEIDILVNNAGIARSKFFQDTTLDDWDAQVNLNGRGVFLTTQAALPYIPKKGRIVSVSSTGARCPYEGLSVYNATKSMVESFTRVWALELGRTHEISVNCIQPGPTNTAGFNGSSPEFLAKLQPMLDATPLGARMADPSEIAVSIGLLCEPKAHWITGVCLGINGGFYMS